MNPKTKVIFQTGEPEMQDFMKNLPAIFSQKGRTIKNARNEIKIIEFGEIELCIKSFNKITVFNRFIYSWLRATKARRSYLMAKQLLKKNINTPYPIGYTEVRGRFGILKKSFYVSAYQSHDWLMGDITRKSHPEEKRILKAFSNFMATKVHPAGVWHKDLSPGNILINRNGNSGYNFSLVDLNRIKILKRTTSRKGIRNLQKLSDKPLILAQMAEFYAIAAHKNPNHFAFSLIGSHLAFSWFRRISKRFLHNFKVRQRITP